MAIQEEQPIVATQADAHSPQIIANAFVLQYYYILQYSPELVHRFYCENSSLGRPEADGELSCVTTMKAINEKIISLNCNLMPEINKIDAQASFGGGVTVLVTGNMTSQDGTIKKFFTQSFFLAPQDNGYFVLNDMFRYVDDFTVQCGTNGFLHQTETHLMQEKGILLSNEQNIVVETTPSIEVTDAKNEAVYDLSDNGEGSVVDEEPVANGSVYVPTETQVHIESMKMTMHEEIPKKSYASIVRVMKENISPLSPPARNISKPNSVKAEQTIKPAQPLSNGSHNSIPNSINKDHGNVRVTEAEGFSIYIKNLPMNVTPPQIEVVFKSFGPIKRNGIQVRSHKHQGFCFGFVEYEVADAVQRAIEASPFIIGGNQVHVEGKRTSNSRVNKRGRFVPGRGGGGFRNGNFSGGGKGHTRGGDFGNRGGRWGYQRSENGGDGYVNGQNGNSSKKFEVKSSNGS